MNGLEGKAGPIGDPGRSSPEQGAQLADGSETPGLLAEGCGVDAANVVESPFQRTVGSVAAAQVAHG